MEWCTLTLVKTGNEELDRRLGGIPHPSLIFVEGEHGVGKTVLSAQFAKGFLESGFKGVFVTTEHLTFDLLVKLKEVKLDLSPWFLNGSLRIAPLNVRKFSWKSKFAEDLISVLLNFLKNVRCSFCIIDSLTLLSLYSEPRQTLDLFKASRIFADIGKTMIFTMHPGVHPESLHTEVRSIVDVYFRIKNVVIGGRRLKSLERIKNAGGAIGSDIISFDVDPSLGLRVVPLSLSRG
ncbi:flagellar accessory protein FlaH [Candidatus Marsarchaeota G2 archaeon BE_D]|jgi:flagellar protein FlaH|uniref:Flagellar accessory protein FlaH n=3 Tax=Candidatus Marsarchaeota TaxID=1978152 RepID=A0A2R6CE35_9ARCH|nr:MAG: flagellar accessory protein FlaH [Candidatus Marsarchaeota G1 archaeon OSP_D]PSN87808.1 MAG: flagellar accessory protein FlaH [Candidatus Marsarchaeota G1 archaeon OSP_C]PSO09157.1 MAG: flagellar accessory protein FlaH [Candidatus Marsarchaeota G2 archaeon BE_D]